MVQLLLTIWWFATHNKPSQPGHQCFVQTILQDTTILNPRDTIHLNKHNARAILNKENDTPYLTRWCCSVLIVQYRPASGSAHDLQSTVFTTDVSKSWASHSKRLQRSVADCLGNGPILTPPGISPYIHMLGMQTAVIWMCNCATTCVTVRELGRI